MPHHVPIKPEAPDPHSLATTWAVCALVELLVAHTHWPMDPHGVAEECRVGAINLLAKGIADCQSFSRVKQDTQTVALNSRALRCSEALDFATLSSLASTTQAFWRRC